LCAAVVWQVVLWMAWTLVPLADSGHAREGLPQVKKFYVWLMLFVVYSALRTVPQIRVLAFFFQAEDGIRDRNVTEVQTCALPICQRHAGDHERRGGVEPARLERGRLEVRSAVAGRDEPHPLRLPGDVLRSLEVADRPGLAPLERDRKSVV